MPDRASYSYSFLAGCPTTTTATKRLRVRALISHYFNDFNEYIQSFCLLYSPVVEELLCTNGQANEKSRPNRFENRA